jgi:hypothetical protein
VCSIIIALVKFLPESAKSHFAFWQGILTLRIVSVV